MLSVSDCFKYPHGCPLFLVKMWCKQLCAISRSHEIFPKVILIYDMKYLNTRSHEIFPKVTLIYDMKYLNTRSHGIFPKVTLIYDMKYLNTRSHEIFPKVTLIYDMKYLNTRSHEIFPKVRFMYVKFNLDSWSLILTHAKHRLWEIYHFYCKK